MTDDETLVLQTDEGQVSTLFKQAANSFLQHQAIKENFIVSAAKNISEGNYESPVLDAKISRRIGAESGGVQTET